MSLFLTFSTLCISEANKWVVSKETFGLVQRELKEESCRLGLYCFESHFIMFPNSKSSESWAAPGH